jgi:hypothetical protein
MAEGIYQVTEMFERELCRYTGAPYAVAVDNGSNALFLALKYEMIEGMQVFIPVRTYPSVPCEIIHAGGIPVFSLRDVTGDGIRGAYNLRPTKVWDSALRFTADMYIPGSHMCLSFTGPHKHLKLGKGGAILTDDHDAAAWFKRARFSGRREMPYHEDTFDMLGWNFYLMPEIAARGVLMMAGFYKPDGTPKQMPDIRMPYPDLSRCAVYGGSADG